MPRGILNSGKGKMEENGNWNFLEWILNVLLQTVSEQQLYQFLNKSKIKNIFQEETYQQK